MKLVRVKVEGYRSIAKSLQIPLDPAVTVVLGANDHGKSNVLAALHHLNPDSDFAEGDLHWDMEDSPDRFPRIQYELMLDSDECAALLKIENEFRRTPTGSAAGDLDATEEEPYQLLILPAAPVQATKTQTAATSLTNREEAEEEEEEEEEEGDEENGTNGAEPNHSATEEAVTPPPPLVEVSASVTLLRQGLKGQLLFRTSAEIHANTLRAFLRKRLPRVELFQSQQTLKDSIEHDDLEDEDYEFMRGIFHYSGFRES